MDHMGMLASLILILILPHGASCLSYEAAVRQYSNGQQTPTHPAIDRELLREKLENIVDRDFPAHEERYKRFLPTHQDDDVSTFDNRTVSKDCAQAMEVYEFARSKFWMVRPEWAWRMDDSNGRRGPGLLDGNFNWLGNSDECMRVKATQENYTTVLGQFVGTHDFDAMYCRVYYPIEEDWFYFSHSACMPDVCSELDVAIIYTTDTDYVEPRNVYCHDSSKSFWNDASAIVAFVVVLIFLLLVASATIFHYVITRPPTPLNNVTPEMEMQGVYVNKGADIQENGTYPKQSETPTVIENGTPNGDANGLPTVVNGTYPKQSDNPETSAAGDVVKQAPSNPPPNQGVTFHKSGLEEVGVAGKLLLSFSLMRNLPSVLTTASVGRGYLCLNGMRFLSMAWIILGHTWQLTTYILVSAKHQQMENQLYFFDKVLPNGWASEAFINHMNYGVETFFVMGGCLVMISILKMFQRGAKCKDLGLYYFHRYWRLTPVYMLIVMMYAGFFPYLGAGATADETMQYNYCRESWWKNLLYLTFLEGPTPSCMGWSWYVSDDFWFYCLAPFFGYLLYRWPKAGYVAMAIAWVITTVCKSVPIVLGAEYFKYIYLPPYSRYGPYVIGMALGYFMLKTKCKVHIPKAGVVAGWILFTIFIWICLLGEFYGPPTVVQIFYNIFVRDMFSLCIAWFIFACCSGYGGLVNDFLSWSFWTPLSRLTYVGYLIHPIIMDYYQMFRIRQFYVNDQTMMLWYCGFLLMAVMVALPITLVFEIPFLELEKVMFPKKKKK